MNEKITILWNGGWDEYEVDTSDVIEDKVQNQQPLIYPAEMKINGNCFDPHYVRACFSGSLQQRFLGKAVRVLQHLAGGD